MHLKCDFSVDSLWEPLVKIPLARQIFLHEPLRSHMGPNADLCLHVYQVGFSANGPEGPSNNLDPIRPAHNRKIGPKIGPYKGEGEDGEGEERERERERQRPSPSSSPVSRTVFGRAQQIGLVTTFFCDRS